MLYLDTSLIVTALTNEQATVDVQNWLMRQHIDELAVSDWTITEVSSALSMKVRMAELSPAGRSAAATKFDDLKLGIRLLNVGSHHFLTAARFAGHHDLGLRAGDALHLAIAAGHGAAVLSLDRRMIKAGLTIGVTVRSPID